MPLVVPGLQSKDGDGKKDDWMNKLMGKKLGESSDTTTFAKTELPKEHRVLKEGDMASTDFKPDRLNIHTAADGTVTNVKYG